MKSFHLQIVTPDGLYFDGDAEKVIVRTIVGDVCIMANHAEYITALGMGEAKVTVAQNSQQRRAACIGGMLTATKNNVRILASTFEWAEDIDKERAAKSKAKAEQQLAAPNLDPVEKKVQEARLKRAIVRLRVAG